MTNVWVTGQGTMYIANSASSAADSQLPFPSADLVASLSASPISITAAIVATDQLEDTQGNDPNNFDSSLGGAPS